MRIILFLFAFLAACDSPRPATEATTSAVQSPCRTRNFEGSRFTVCPAGTAGLEVFTSNASGAAYRNFSALQATLGDRSEQVVFGMNAGMFDEEGQAIGLLIERGKQLHRINRRGDGGNFGLLPNGIFLVRDDGAAEVVETGAYEPSDDIAFATQSGPMLVIDGKLHPKFEPDGESRNIRNGVGIGPDGRAMFVISEDVVSFGKFARLFRDVVKARNALYFDGSVSSLWDPVNGRQDARAELGPLVVAFRRAESAPGREAPATP